MAAYRRFCDSRHMQADCQEPRSALERDARQSSMGYLFRPVSTRPVGRLSSVKCFSICVGEVHIELSDRSYMPVQCFLFMHFCCFFKIYMHVGWTVSQLRSGYCSSAYSYSKKTYTSEIFLNLYPTAGNFKLKFNTTMHGSFIFTLNCHEFYSLSPPLTKLCHIKRERPVNFYILLQNKHIFMAVWPISTKLVTMTHNRSLKSSAPVLRK